MREEALLDNKNDRDSDAEDRDVGTQLSKIEDYGCITLHSLRANIQIITVIGQVEGHTVLSSTTKTTKYEHIIPQLAAIEESPRIDGLLILLNTVGGDIEAGLAIAEVIASMKKPTVSLVLGGGHSIGVPLTVSAKRSFIVPSASMTIHPVRYSGMIISAPQTYRYLDRIEERIVGFVVKHSRISEQRYQDLMKSVGELATDIGSILDGEEAVKSGLVDSLGGIAEAYEALYGMIEEGREKA
ncbi:MAG: hypothetical protein GXX99_02820 [Clostridiales bacterium]|nr:hypothetical protein [Clostridiales bacterium]